MPTDKSWETPRRFRKKPIEIEAMFYDGDNGDALSRWAGWMTVFTTEPHRMEVRTPNGPVVLVPREWLLKGVEGEFYPCKPDIFEATYEVVADGH